MPPAAPLIGAAVAAAGSFATGAKLFGLGITGTAFLKGAVTLALGFVSSALAPKPPRIDFSPAVGNEGRIQQIQQPLTARRIIYGERRVSGPLVYAGTEGNDNRFLHLIIALADHEIEEIGTIYFNDVPIHTDDLDSDGNVVSGDFDGSAQIRKMLGKADQLADPVVLESCPDWTTEHRLRGIAYVFVRLKYDRDVYPTAIPSISAIVKGKKLFDPRDGGTRWSANTALAVRDYLSNGQYGFGAVTAEIDDTLVQAAANVCDEVVQVTPRPATAASVDGSNNWIVLNEELLFLQTGDRVEVSSSGALPGGLAAATDYYVVVVKLESEPTIRLASSYSSALANNTLPLTSAGSGTLTVTKTGEPRYAVGGAIEVDQNLNQSLEDLLSAMAGRLVHSSGIWKVRAGAYEAPSITLDESDLRGPIRVQTRQPRRERFNAVKGVYASPVNRYVPTDWPGVTNEIYRLADGGEKLWRDLDLPFTTRPHSAQRLGKILLERHRQEITLSYPAKLTALPTEAGGTVAISNARLGWVDKPFEVVDWTLVVDDQGDGEESGPILGVDLELRETAPTVYDWANGEETGVDPAPNTLLPNPRRVAPPTGLVVASEQIKTATGDETYRASVSWTPALDLFVTDGGRYEVQWRQSADAEYRPSWFVDGEQTQAAINQLERGVTYDVRVRSVNALGVRSGWVTLFGFTVTSPAGATTQIDYGEFSTAVTQMLDYGEFSTPVTQNLDYGEFA